MAQAATPTAREEAFDDVLEDLSGEVLLTTSSIDDFASLVAVLEAGAESDDDGTRVNVLTTAETAKALRQTFVLASRVVDLIEADVLAVRAAEPRAPFSTVLIGDLAVRSVAGVAPDAVTTLSADADESLVESAREAFLKRWEDAAEFSTRAPPYSRMVDSVETTLGETVREDLETLFGLSAALTPAETEMDPVQQSLLVGAKNEVQFYELGLWGESEGVASRAKFSREKQTLEELDLVATEKIPTDVGRPRQRLVLGGAVDTDDVEELYETAREALAE